MACERMQPTGVLLKLSVSTTPRMATRDLLKRRKMSDVLVLRPSKKRREITKGKSDTISPGGGIS